MPLSATHFNRVDLDVNPLAQAFATYPTLQNLEKVRRWVQRERAHDDTPVRELWKHIMAWADMRGQRERVLSLVARHAPDMAARLNAGLGFTVVERPSAENRAAILAWLQSRKRKRGESSGGAFGDEVDEGGEGERHVRLAAVALEDEGGRAAAAGVGGGLVEGVPHVDALAVNGRGGRAITIDPQQCLQQQSPPQSL